MWKVGGTGWSVEHRANAFDSNTSLEIMMWNPGILRANFCSWIRNEIKNLDHRLFQTRDNASKAAGSALCYRQWWLGNMFTDSFIFLSSGAVPVSLSFRQWALYSLHSLPLPDHLFCQKTGAMLWRYTSNLTSNFQDSEGKNLVRCGKKQRPLVNEVITTEVGTSGGLLKQIMQLKSSPAVPVAQWL